MLHVSVAEVAECLICRHPVLEPAHETEEIEMMVVVIEQVRPAVGLARAVSGADADVSQALG